MGTNDAYLASETLLVYGGGGFLADLSGFAGAASAAGRTISEPVTVLGSTETEIDALRVGHVVRPGPLYSGSEVDKLRANSEGIVCVLFTDSKDGLAFPCVVNGLGRNANVEQLVQRQITFVQAGQFVDGTADGTNTRLVAFDADTRTPSVTVAAGNVGYLIVTKGSGSFTGAVTVTASAPGIYDASGLKSGTLSVPASTEGYLLTGVPGMVD